MSAGVMLTSRMQSTPIGGDRAAARRVTRATKLGRFAQPTAASSSAVPERLATREAPIGTRPVTMAIIDNRPQTSPETGVSAHRRVGSSASLVGAIPTEPRPQAARWRPPVSAFAAAMAAKQGNLRFLSSDDVSVGDDAVAGGRLSVPFPPPRGEESSRVADSHEAKFFKAEPTTIESPRDPLFPDSPRGLASRPPSASGVARFSASLANERERHRKALDSAWLRANAAEDKLRAVTAHMDRLRRVADNDGKQLCCDERVCRLEIVAGEAAMRSAAAMQFAVAVAQAAARDSSRPSLGPPIRDSDLLRALRRAEDRIRLLERYIAKSGGVPPSGAMTPLVKYSLPTAPAGPMIAELVKPQRPLNPPTMSRYCGSGVSTSDPAVAARDMDPLGVFDAFLVEAHPVSM